MQFEYASSPVGDLLLAGDSAGLRRIGFPSGKGAVEPQPRWRHESGCFSDVARQLEEYFGGRRRCFDVELSLSGTEFQLCVLAALMDIPYGETRSYAEIATAINRPAAVRAVGTANSRNPIPILIPCHRVIGADGSLTGFGGGMEVKRFLLNLESIVQL